jgi:hypothetical protein
VATVDSSYSAGLEALRTFLLGASGDISTFKAWAKAAINGDILLKCTPSTIAASPGSAAWEEDILVTLETNDGELINCYSGYVTLAVADTSTAGTASILTSAGTTAGVATMTDGQLWVKLKGDAAAWNTANTATLAVNATANNPGLVGASGIATATCVLTIGAS